MKALAVIVLSCSACAYGTTMSYSRESTIEYGFHVRYTDDAKQLEEDIDSAMWVLIYEFVSHGANYDKIMQLLKEHGKDYPIYVVTQRFKCDSGVDGKCMGEFLAGSPLVKRGSIAFVQNKCIGLSPFAHEFIHLVDHLLYDRRDYMHQNSELFEVGCLWKYKRGTEQLRECIAHTIERSANVKLCDRICGGCSYSQLNWQFSEPP